MDHQAKPSLTLYHIVSLLLLYSCLGASSIWAGNRLGKLARLAIQNSVSAARQGEASLHLMRASRPAGQLKLPPKSIDQAPDLAVPEHQRSILLIGIDDFQAKQPRLEGLWMVFYLNDLPHFILVPIYPNRQPGTAMKPLVDQQLAAIFSLQSDGSPHPTFLQALRDKDIWWNGYLMLDKTALEQIQDYSHQHANRSEHTPLESIPPTNEDPLQALLGQTRLAQQLCQSSTLALGNDIGEILDFLDKTSTHLSTDLNLHLLLVEIHHGLQVSGGVSCEFPTLAALAWHR